MAEAVLMDRYKFSWLSVTYCLLGGGPVVCDCVG